jgi:hypothetical protein
VKTLTADEYAELQRRGITCTSCYTYQKKWDSLQGCEFWNEGNASETWGEAEVRAEKHPICCRFCSLDWRLSHPLGSSRGKGR